MEKSAIIDKKKYYDNKKKTYEQKSRSEAAFFGLTERIEKYSLTRKDTIRVRSRGK